LHTFEGTESVCIACVYITEFKETGNDRRIDWIGLSSVLRPHQHSIGYMGNGFYRWIGESN